MHTSGKKKTFFSAIGYKYETNIRKLCVRKKNRAGFSLLSSEGGISGKAEKRARVAVWWNFRGKKYFTRVAGRATVVTFVRAFVRACGSVAVRQRRANKPGVISVVCAFS